MPVIIFFLAIRFVPLFLLFLDFVAWRCGKTQGTVPFAGEKALGGLDGCGLHWLVVGGRLERWTQNAIL